ncbi:M16 family metallopeptidase [Alkalicoccobacillus plakortidis]|uniref:Insulinase family protein n=1 Tax=Alkalicoccobacillus plakortidis TaxID=444060 RepID=A0ABT0XG70_9BACI|nr:pitrilysin family protein [Alkalicoccobacillus plakortidis]MCM2674695.1 insulinase family protein [Alkalicoccobacillus plakortidis]
MIQKIDLANGVRILVEPISTVRSVSMGIWVGTGSRNETQKENGLSHLLEHMLFKGTHTRSPQDIAEAFDQIGGQVNAFTSKEYTCYYAKVLDEHSFIALDVLQDMFFNSTFDEEELEKEKNVIGEEIRMVEDTPDDLVHELLSEACYGSHPLAYPILGTDQTLSSFTSADLRAYMDRFYTGDYVVISVAGNIDETLIEQLKTTFAKVKPTVQTEILTKPQFVQEQRIRAKEAEQAHLCIGYNGLAIDDPSIYSLVLLNNSFGGSMSSRLFQEIREKRGLCYSVFSYHSSFSDSGLLTLYAWNGYIQLDALVEAVEETTHEMAEKGMTEKELKNGKEQLKGSLMLSLESTNSRMSRNGKNELMLRQHRTMDEMLDEINSVTLDSVNELSERILTSKPALSLVSTTGEWPNALK